MLSANLDAENPIPLHEEAKPCLYKSIVTRGEELVHPLQNELNQRRSSRSTTREEGLRTRKPH